MFFITNAVLTLEMFSLGVMFWVKKSLNSFIFLTTHFKIKATHGTASYLLDQGIKVSKINKVSQGSPHIVEDLLDEKIDILINTTEGRKSINDSFSVRRTALMKSLPYFLTISGARAAINSIKELRNNDLEVNQITSFH